MKLYIILSLIYLMLLTNRIITEKHKGKFFQVMNDDLHLEGLENFSYRFAAKFYIVFPFLLLIHYVVNNL